MMWNYYGGGYNQMWGGNWGTPFGMGFLGIFLVPLMLAFVVWTIYWKYRALWYAAKHDHKWWFVALLIINTLGILEILYLYYFSKQMDAQKHDEKSVPMAPPQQ